MPQACAVPYSLREGDVWAITPKGSRLKMQPCCRLNLAMSYEQQVERLWSLIMQVDAQLGVYIKVVTND